MSLILDALKKLEQERAGRRGKVTDLGPAIVSGSYPKRSSTRRTYVIVGVAVTATAAVTVIIMQSLIVHRNAPRPAPPTTGAVTVSASPATIAPPATATPAEPPTTPPARPAAVPATAPAAAVTPPPPRREAYAAPAIPAAQPSSFNVSGIAWQEDRGGRRAVVNGTLVGEGSSVAGAVVREILPDRVILSAGGQQVEVINSSPFR